MKKQKTISKNQKERELKIEKAVKYAEDTKNARATKIVPTSYGKKTFNTVTVLTRKIARNMAKKMVGSNKIADTYNSIWNGKPNYDKKHIQKLNDMQYRDKRKAQEIKLEKEKKSKAKLAKANKAKSKLTK